MRDRSILGHDLGNVYNLCEPLVIEAVEAALKADSSLCRCAVCIEDVYALALNKHPARYIQDDYSRRDLSRIIDAGEVKKMVLQAIDEVRRNPHHN